MSFIDDHKSEYLWRGCVAVTPKQALLAVCTYKTKVAAKKVLKLKPEASLKSRKQYKILKVRLTLWLKMLMCVLWGVGR